MFAEVALNVPLAAGDRVFTFAIPAALEPTVAVGTAVRVPFGRQTTSGFVVRLVSEFSRPVKAIAAIDNRMLALPSDLVSLAWWMADHYVCSVGEAIFAMLPPPLRRSRPESSNPGMSVLKPDTSDAVPDLSDPAGIVPLLAAGPQARIAVVGEDARFDAYEAALKWVSSQRRRAVVMVPEVAQAERMAAWVTRRVGAPVALLLGDRPAPERWNTWRAILSGEFRIIVGTRLAVFAPVTDLALIILDHEEDTSYKEERTPRYHARRVAEERARLTAAALVLGSPSPSLEVIRAVEAREAIQLALPPPARPMIAISDTRAEAGRLGGLFGRRLFQALARTLPKGRAMIFVPRRGFADFLLCHECGNVPRCRRCGVAMTYHAPAPVARSQRRRQTNRSAPPGPVVLRCHLCGETEPVPEVCPVCRGTQLRPHGIGTEGVEQAARRLFRGTPVLRLDTDVAPDEPTQQQVWHQFSRRGGLLIGTQLLVKGVGRVPAAVVGAVGIDAALHLPDFRAAERTYQIVTQLMHLAQDEMIIQTFSPNHPVLVALARQDASKFYRDELAARQRFGYPPFRTLVNLLCTGADNPRVRERAQQLAAALAEDADVLGPSPAPLARIRDRYRWQILVKEREDGAARKRLAELLTTTKFPRRVKVTVDVDPVDLL